MDEISIKCDDGCRVIKFEKETWKGFPYLNVFLYIDSGLTITGFWELVRVKVKLIWAILRGKEYNLFDIMLSDNNLKEFYKNMGEFIKDESLDKSE